MYVCMYGSGQPYLYATRRCVSRWACTIFFATVVVFALSWCGCVCVCVGHALSCFRAQKGYLITVSTGCITDSGEGGVKSQRCL